MGLRNLQEKLEKAMKVSIQFALPDDVYMVSLPESLKKPFEPAESLEDLADEEGEVTPFTASCLLGVS